MHQEGDDTLFKGLEGLLYPGAPVTQCDIDTACPSSHNLLRPFPSVAPMQPHQGGRPVCYNITNVDIEIQRVCGQTGLGCSAREASSVE